MLIRELITEYILFAFTEDQLRDQFQISELEIADLSDQDLLEMYDQTLLFHTIKAE